VRCVRCCARSPDTAPARPEWRGISRALASSPDLELLPGRPSTVTGAQRRRPRPRLVPVRHRALGASAAFFIARRCSGRCHAASVVVTSTTAHCSGHPTPSRPLAPAHGSYRASPGGKSRDAVRRCLGRSRVTSSSSLSTFGLAHTTSSRTASSRSSRRTGLLRPVTTCSVARSARKNLGRAVEARSGLASELRPWGDAGVGSRFPAGQGRVNDDEPCCLYRGSRCLVCPVPLRGSGLSVARAMAVGRRWSASRRCPEEVAGGAAVRVDALDPDAIAQASRRRSESATSSAGSAWSVARGFTWSPSADLSSRSGWTTHERSARRRRRRVLGRHRTRRTNLRPQLLASFPTARAAGLRVAAVTPSRLVADWHRGERASNSGPGAAAGWSLPRLLGRSEPTRPTPYTLPLSLSPPGRGPRSTTSLRARHRDDGPTRTAGTSAAPCRVRRSFPSVLPVFLSARVVISSSF